MANHMRRIYKWMFVLAVVSATSCEKEPEITNNIGPGNEIASETPTEYEYTAKMFHGLWTRCAEADPKDEQAIITKVMYAWRFYEDGNGHLSIDDYNNSGIILGMTRASFNYFVKNDLLYVKYTNNESETIEWQFRFNENKDELIVYDKENDLEFAFKKGIDASPKFMGDWSMLEVLEDGRRLEKHFKFTTPADGFTYEVLYNKEGTVAEETTIGRDFKYAFDNDMLTVTFIGPEHGGQNIYYYRIDGQYLYLKTTFDGIERCYKDWRR